LRETVVAFDAEIPSWWGGGEGYLIVLCLCWAGLMVMMVFVGVGEEGEAWDEVLYSMAHPPLLLTITCALFEISQVENRGLKRGG